ncbi:hypothetical protein Hgul01_02534 [Herpetosiphon gulosus]|uniref:Uncharacterized protein n=1 Tax=Herpetosiphon gulosus TaxID=1973496 RepID=A0ABP9WZW5_9CHLR
MKLGFLIHEGHEGGEGSGFRNEGAALHYRVQAGSLTPDR